MKCPDLSSGLHALLAPLAGPEGPGASIGLFRGGALLAQESIGLASVELGVPVGPETAFRIASVSKQFTCAAILMLAEDGKLAVTDDLRRHLPELPDLGATVTLAHCMQNSSGLRDMLELLRLGGIDIAEPVGAEALLAAIGRQRALNFAPGSRFLYSNTGFMLLGLVVERVSGKAFGDFLAERIFTPAGMTRTRHVASTADIVPGLACGYLPRPGDGAQGGFRRARHGLPLGGEGGLVSTVGDLGRWLDFLVAHPVLDAALQQQACFPNGTANPYANGVEIRAWRGLRTVSHGGLWPGFRTCFLRAPSLGLAVVAIANHGGLDAHHLAHQALDLMLEAEPNVAPPPVLPAGLAAYAGRWIAAGGSANFDLALDGAGTPWVTQHGVPFALEPLGGRRLGARRAAFPFVLEPDGENLTVQDDPGERTVFHRAPAEAAAPVGLRGHYLCAELDTDWTVSARDGAPSVLVEGPLRHAGPWRLQPIAPDLLRLQVPGDAWSGWFDVVVRRNGAGEAIALHVHGARTQGLVFNRLG